MSSKEGQKKHCVHCGSLKHALTEPVFSRHLARFEKEPKGKSCFFDFAFLSVVIFCFVFVIVFI